jgi:hypothetical protein
MCFFIWIFIFIRLKIVSGWLRGQSGWIGI